MSGTVGDARKRLTDPVTTTPLVAERVAAAKGEADERVSVCVAIHEGIRAQAVREAVAAERERIALAIEAEQPTHGHWAAVFARDAQ